MTKDEAIIKWAEEILGYPLLEFQKSFLISVIHGKKLILFRPRK